jgi:MFS superfamily sulfate permease-like transporter
MRRAPRDGQRSRRRIPGCDARGAERFNSSAPVEFGAAAHRCACVSLLTRKWCPAPMSLPALVRRPAWFAPVVLRTEVLSGLVVALALIPEAIAFSIIAGVDPRVGLFASVTMAVTIAFVGGRPAMISAATGAVALVVAPVVREHVWRD